MIQLKFSEALMNVPAVAEGTGHVLDFPYDIMHIVFSKLRFMDKINAGMTCKQWEQLLKAGTANARHWDVRYDLDRVQSSAACARSAVADSTGMFDTVIRRWVTVCKS